MANNKSVSIKFVPANLNDRSPVVLHVPNAPTDKDKALVDGFLSSGLSLTVFENCGTKSYNKAYQEVAIEKDGELMAVGMAGLTDGEKEAALRDYVVCLDQCKDLHCDCYDDALEDELERVIKKRSEVCVTPNGELFEKFVSELSIAPIMNGDEYNFGNSNVLAHLEHWCITVEDKGSEYQESLKENYKSAYVIYHEGTGVSLSYEPDAAQPFDGTSLNVDFRCDSLYLALVFKFSWAVKECDYGSEQKVEVCTRWDNLICGIYTFHFK